MARDLGLLHVPDGTLVDLGAARDLPRERVALITAGSQAEAASALVRIAMDAHKQVQLAPGDTVVLSSRIIPGNERAISSLVNHLYRRGAVVHYDRDVAGARLRPRVAGGAEARAEPRPPARTSCRCTASTATSCATSRLAAEVGIPRERCHLLEDGDVLELDARRRARAASASPPGRVFVDGKGIGDVEDVVLRDRRHLSEDGLVLAVLAIAPAVGRDRRRARPRLARRGRGGGEPRGARARAEAAVLEALAAINPESRTDPVEVKEEVRRALRRYFKRFDRRPVILPFVMEM